jgi:hypothetical protein
VRLLEEVAVDGSIVGFERRSEREACMDAVKARLTEERTLTVDLLQCRWQVVDRAIDLPNRSAAAEWRNSSIEPQ